MSKIIVLIVTYNGEKWIYNCLNSLQQSSVPLKAIVIDNASADNTKHIIKNNFPHITLVENEKNLGFGQANNTGIKQAISENADYIFLLNQDASVDPDTIEKLLAIHKQHAEYGIISPIQLNGQGNELDRAFRKYILNNYSDHFLHQIEQQDNKIRDIFPVRFVNAAAWFISKECIKRVGLFHPLFYHYGEDNNYCSRVQYHNFKTGITPLATIRHDRTYNPGQQFLLRQINIVPLYMILDIRKRRIVAYSLVLWKLTGYFCKGIIKQSAEIRQQTFSRMKWLFANTSVIKNIRRDLKNQSQDF